jgi:L-lactate dehydrogenase complex protein LldG
MTDPDARDAILARLNRAAEKTEIAPESACLPFQDAPPEARIEQLKRLLEAVHSEVHRVEGERWTDTLKDVLLKRDIKTLLYAPRAAIGPAIESAWRETPGAGLPALCAFDRDIEAFKAELFRIDAAVTTAAGAIAESGAVVLRPDTREPRLMSLVPPVHIVVLEADRVCNTFCEIIEKQGWTANMPTNALLISGPSRTADIEMTVAFGVHGPRELIVIILNGSDS